MSYSTKSKSRLFWIFFLTYLSSFQLSSDCLKVPTLDFSKVLGASSDYQSFLLLCPSAPWTFHNWRKTLWIWKIKAVVQWILSHTSFITVAMPLKYYWICFIYLGVFTLHSFKLALFTPIGQTTPSKHSLVSIGTLCFAWYDLDWFQCLDTGPVRKSTWMSSLSLISVIIGFKYFHFLCFFVETTLFVSAGSWFCGYVVGRFSHIF